jgi:purine-binding chemotaxis protein CheW
VADPGASCVYGVLRVGAVEVAIAAANLQEAVNWPGSVTPRPLSAPYVLGTFNLRGMAIPSIDLRVVFAGARPDADRPPLTGSEKVAIVRLAGGRMGLVVDAISTVTRFRDDEIQCLVGEAATATRSASLIKAVISADGGSRIISIIDLDALASLPDVMLVAAKEPATRLEAERSPLHHYLMFRCADLSFCFDATAVMQIIPWPGIETTALRNEFYRGFVRLHGQMVPVLNLAALLEIGHHPQEDALLLVMELEGLPLGLPIDEVTAIVRRRPADIAPLSCFGVARPALYVGLLPNGGEASPADVLVLDHEALARHEEVGGILRVHAAASGVAAPETAGADVMRGGTRQTFLTYTAAESLASPLAHIREVISYPDSVLRLGTRDGPLAGMMNRRGVMTPLVDLRRLLAEDQRDWSIRPKVLIVPDGFGNIGFIVDSVDAIVFVNADETVISSDRVTVHPGSHPAIAKLLRLAMIDSSVQRRSMTVLDLAALAGTLRHESERAAETARAPAAANLTLV